MYLYLHITLTIQHKNKIQIFPTKKQMNNSNNCDVVGDDTDVTGDDNDDGD